MLFTIQLKLNFVLSFLNSILADLILMMDRKNLRKSIVSHTSGPTKVNDESQNGMPKELSTRHWR